jgi:hypothetical protein
MAGVHTRTLTAPRRSSLLRLAAAPLGSLTLAEAPLNRRGKSAQTTGKGTWHPGSRLTAIVGNLGKIRWVVLLGRDLAEIMPRTNAELSGGAGRKFFQHFVLCQTAQGWLAADPASLKSSDEICVF